MKVLIDTCVIIDALQNRAGFAENAQSIFLGVANRSFTGCISAKSVTDIYYLTHKQTHSDAKFSMTNCVGNVVIGKSYFVIKKMYW